MMLCVWLKTEEVMEDFFEMDIFVCGDCGGGGHKIKTWGKDNIDFLLYLGKCWPNFVSALMILQQHSTIIHIIRYMLSQSCPCRIYF